MKKIVCCLLAVIVVVIFIICGIRLPNNSDVYIFDTLEECEKFENNSSETIQLDKKDTAFEDKSAKGLSYEDFYGAELFFDGFSFEIFAYEFSDESSSMLYFTNETGKKDTLKTNFSSSSGLSKYTLVVIDGVKAYKIISESRDAKKVTDYLSEVFSTRLEFGN